MKSWKKFLSAIAVLAGMALFPAENHAQNQQNDTPPKPAAKVLLPIGVGDDQDQEQPIPAMEPDDRPLTGFQDLTVGTPRERHSYWIPGFSYTNTIASNAFGEGGGNSWNTTNFVAGNLSLLQTWGTSQLSINYSGGEAISSDSAVGSGQFQQFSALQTFEWRRAQLTLLDQFSYLPSAQFGFGAGTSLAAPGVGGPLAPTLPGFQNGFTPNQSIFSAVGPQYSNTSGIQLNYGVTARSSVTIGGVFSLLRFIDPGNIQSNTVVLNAGYNHQVTRFDTLGLSYRFSAYDFLGSPQAIGDHTVQVMYGRRITGRLALRLSGGPDVTTFRVPPGIPPKTEYVAGAGSAGLTYAFQAGSLSLTFNHGVNNGGGGLVGATSNQVTASGSKRLGRTWNGNISVGHARNTNVAGTGGAQGPAYSTLYIGAGLQRPFSRTTNFTMNYTANIETSSNGVCAAANCSTNFTTHQITIGMNWHARPFVMH